MQNLKNGAILPSSAEASEHGCSRNKKRKVIIAVCVVGLVLLVAGLFYLGFSVKLETCTNSSCVHAATQILQHIDIRADPCEDFYRFSCGNFLQNTHLLDNRESRSGSRSVEDIAQDEIQSQIREMLERPILREDPKSFNTAKKFYRACMNETAIARQGLKKIKEILEMSVGWPTLHGYNWDDKKFDWMESVHKLRQLGVSSDVFFRVTVEKDDRGANSRYVIGIHDIPYAELKPNHESRDLLLEYMREIAVMFGADREVAIKDANDTLESLDKLGQIEKDSYLVNKTKPQIERRALSELQYKYRDIQWHHYLSGLLTPATNVNYDDEVIIWRIRYVELMETFLAVTSRRSLANIVAWHTIQELIYYLPEEFAQKTQELIERMNRRLVNFKLPRYKTCLIETEKSLGSVLAAAYIQNSFSENKRYKAMEMIANIKAQAEEIITRSEWMDGITKELVIQSLRTSVEKLPSTGDLLNLLEENKSLYAQIRINESEYLEAVLNLRLVQLYREQSKLRNTYEEEPFSELYTVSGVKIHYSPKENQLTFPVGIFGGVYYQNDRPEYMNYGILGSIIAHEVSHIFMRAARGDQAPRELRSWWSPNSLANYDQKLQCISNQYSNFRLTELRQRHLNPAETLDEDMADLAGMKISYDTYINWSHKNGAQPLLPGLKYSPNQLFWISAAIRHCSKYSQEGLERYIANYRTTNTSPQQFRVNGPLQNLNEFAFDFGCPVGSKMNPENKCNVW
ncbi:neprilysin-2-like isoform X2 [Diabrotica virgifera virgifera]|uniref:Neprilysin-2-like n=1 Tax=Diabrotica virgifera virgifera TaxID=50390 RepID=A0ABM5KHV2_DIAVI|nr:neprilysin-2-like isoform X2 [Diabrotica virgifera virgifera]